MRTDHAGAFYLLHSRAWELLLGALLAIGLRRDTAWHTTATFSLLAAVLVPACALVLPHLLPAGLAQRLAFALWFAWAIDAGALANRRGQP